MIGIPDYQTLMLPVLKIAGQGETTNMMAVESIAKEFRLSPEQLEELLPSGKQTVIANRIHWAKFYMSKAGLIQSIRRGLFKASPTGLQVLAENPTRLDNLYLAGIHRMTGVVRPSFAQIDVVGKTVPRQTASVIRQSRDVCPLLAESVVFAFIRA